MPLRPAIFCVLLLAGCATHTEQAAAPQAQQAPEPQTQKAPVQPAGAPGVILAMRPVRATGPGPVRVLLAGLGTQGATPADHVYEFIVRTGDGTTISIVQPQTIGLHTGERVSILRGAETRIDVPATD